MVKAVRWISFNPRSYKRSDLSSKCLSYFFFSFNPRSYKRSDVTRSPILIPFSDFQSTLLQEERPMHLLLHPQIQSFNPRSYKRSDWLQYWMRMLDNSFNPRSYKRSDAFTISSASPSTLSIHAPTRGAT